MTSATATTKLLELEREVRTLEGRIKNRDPEPLTRLGAENEKLKQQCRQLRETYYALLAEREKPSKEDDLKRHLESLERGAVEYFTKANIDPEIWKNIVS